MIRFIGDVHGKYRQYKKLIKDVPKSIQVGDMGIGFYRTDGSPVTNPPYYAMEKGEHRFIRGNHDNPSSCKKHLFWIPDGWSEDNMFFVGGGLSIDRGFRVEGYSWWKDEELSADEFMEIQEKYIETKPDIMVTHDCPEFFAQRIMGAFNITKLNDPSVTRNSLQCMFEHHKPKLWIFGHWHVSIDTEVLGTRFICLKELEHKDIDIETYS
jgi:hypothetical protein